MPLFDELQCVQLRDSHPDMALPKGSLGVVVTVHTKADPSDEQAYEVEFVDEDGSALCLKTLKEDDLIGF